MSRLSFVAIDVETSNADMASICQIGIADYSGGKLVNSWSSLINPEDEFDPAFTAIHGITDRDVAGAPTLKRVESILREYLENRICVSHGHFDRVSLDKALTKYRLRPLQSIWLDSIRVVRRTWEDVAYRGYGLKSVCRKINYEFRHHDALEDAKACGQILLAACEITGIDVREWLDRVDLPINKEWSGSRPKAPIKQVGNPDGVLFGEMIVFTGELAMTRSAAAALAADVGCSVSENVSKKTTLLVVGNQDIKRLSGKGKSSKHLKAEALISAGADIRMLSEDDFQRLIQIAKM